MCTENNAKIKAAWQGGAHMVGQVGVNDEHEVPGSKAQAVHVRRAEPQLARPGPQQLHRRSARNSGPCHSTSSDCSANLERLHAEGSAPLMSASRPCYSIEHFRGRTSAPFEACSVRAVPARVPARQHHGSSTGELLCACRRHEEGALSRCVRRRRNPAAAARRPGCRRGSRHR